MVFNLFYQATPSIHICSHTRYRLGQCRKYVVIFCFFYRGYEIRRKLDLNSNILFFTLLIIFVSAIFLSALLAYSKSECGRDNLLRTLTYSFKSSSYLKNASHRKRIGSTPKTHLGNRCTGSNNNESRFNTCISFSTVGNTSCIIHLYISLYIVSFTRVTTYYM